MSSEALKIWLERQTKAKLIQLIDEHCVGDDNFLNSLKMKAAAEEPAINLEQIKKSIRKAFWIEDFVHWNEVFSYTSDLEPILETLHDLLEKGEAAVVVELVEHAFDCFAEAANNVHDDGEMGDVLNVLHKLHLNASRDAHPDPIELADRLFQIGLCNEWDILTDAYSVYADLLQKVGQKHYRERVTKSWNMLPQLALGKKVAHNGDDRSDWLDGLMIRFMKEADDFDGEIRIRSRDLSKSWNFRMIARRCVETGRKSEALDWFQKGLPHFKDDVGFRRECAEFYGKMGRHDDAIQIEWATFETNHTLKNYCDLLAEAEKLKERAKWKEKAIASIRAHIAENKGNYQSYWKCGDHSLLVEIFLMEGDPQQAWAEAEKGDCSAALWVQLCEQREADRPDLAYPVYMTLAEEAVQRKNNDAYRVAIQRIIKAKQLAESCDQLGAFDTMLWKIKMMNKPKRNFMKFLAESGL